MKCVRVARCKYDPWNNRSYRDNNPSEHKKITKEIIDFYFPYGIEVCGCCPLGNCENCNFKDHPTVSKEKLKKNPKKGKSVVETKTVGIKDPRKIFLSRATLAWLYYNNIPFIFRAVDENKIIQHHKNGNPIDDRPQNIAMITPKTHGKVTSNDQTMRKVIGKIQSLMNSNPNSQELRDCLKLCQEARLRLLDVDTEEYVWNLIKEVYEEIQKSEEEQKLKEDNNAVQNVQQLAV